MYMMTHMPTLTAYFINPSRQSVFVCVSLLSLLGKGSVKCIPPYVAWQRLDKHVPVAKNTSNNRRIAGSMCLCVPLSLLGYNSVKTFQRQGKIVGGIVLLAVRAVSKKSMRLVLSRTSGYILLQTPDQLHQENKKEKKRNIENAETTSS
jgi:hypothetical protein